MSTVTPIIMDLSTSRELWDKYQCAAYCGLQADSWRARNAKHITPPPATKLAGNNLWYADQVKDWRTNHTHYPHPGKNEQPTRIVVPTVLDKTTGKELWTPKQCAEYCGIVTSTWVFYLGQRRVPEPVGAIMGRRTNVWFAEDVIAWHARRPGRGRRRSPEDRYDY